MSFYDAIIKTLDDEQSKKRLWIYGANKALVTRFFPTQKPYPIIGCVFSNTNNQDAANRQPTIYTPWDKVLSSNTNNMVEAEYANKATFLRALISIIGQLIYDISNAIFYTIIAIPSFVMGAIYLFYSNYEEDDLKKKVNKQLAQNYLCNMLLSPYFAVAIIVDFFREFFAFFSRTYNTAIQTKEEMNKLNSTMG